jgi:tripartite-type tricarboxylate transporter receptor subunit TctC
MQDTPQARTSRRALLVGGVAALLGTGARAADARFPSRPIKLLVGFGPGGAGDTVARLYAQKLQEVLGTPVIVENKPGAYQLMAIRPLLQAAPDG